MPSATPCSDALSQFESAFVGLTEFGFAVADIIALVAEEDWPAALLLLTTIKNSATAFSVNAAAALNSMIACVRSFIGSGNMAGVCSPTHSVKTQGAGLCCAAVAAGQLVKPPAGTTLPVYTPGAAASLPTGRIAQVTDSGGHCASCMIVGSSSRKHFGKPVLKFIRGGPGCAVAGSGCCAMAA